MVVIVIMLFMYIILFIVVLIFCRVMVMVSGNFNLVVMVYWMFENVRFEIVVELEKNEFNVLRIGVKKV